MTRILPFSVAVVLTLALAVGVGAGTIAAQDDPETNSTEPNATDDDLDGEGEPAANESDEIDESGDVIETTAGFEEAVDSDVTVANWSYDTGAERFSITLEVDSRTTVSITEVVSVDSAQATDMSVYQDRLSPGTHEVEIAAAPGASGEASVVISTPESMRQGRATVLSTGYVPQELPFQQTGSVAGWFGGFLTTISMVTAAAYKVKSKKHEPVVVCEP